MDRFNEYRTVESVKQTKLWPVGCEAVLPTLLQMPGWFKIRTDRSRPDSIQGPVIRYQLREVQGDKRYYYAYTPSECQDWYHHQPALKLKMPKLPARQRFFVQNLPSRP